MAYELQVQKYLRSGKSFEELKEEFGINHKYHESYPQLVSLKYDQRDSHEHRGKRLTQECRGLILDWDDDFKIVAHSFNRFFNYGEGYCAEVDWETARVWEKVDGSLCIMYWYDGNWRVATSGTPDASGNVMGSEKTFRKYFWEVFTKQCGITCLFNLPTNVTFIFELCGRLNENIIRHDRDHLVFLGARDISQGNELHLDSLKPDLFPNTSAPKTFDFKSAKEILPLMKTMKGLESEGFVVCDANFNRIKMKSDDYKRIHHLKDGLNSQKNIVDIVRQGEIDEVLTAFPMYKERLREAEEKYNALVKELELYYDGLKHIKEQKAFALQAVGTICPGALFAVRAGKCISIEDFLRNKITIDKLMKLLGYYKEEEND